jgi:hypothetical protein
MTDEERRQKRIQDAAFGYELHFNKILRDFYADKAKADRIIRKFDAEKENTDGKTQ